MNRFKVGHLYRINSLHGVEKLGLYNNVHYEKRCYTAPHNGIFLLLDDQASLSNKENTYLKLMYKNAIGWFLLEPICEELIEIEE